MTQFALTAVLVLPSWALATAADSPAPVGGKAIWRLTDIPDREKTRIEFPFLIRFKENWYCSFREGEIHGNHPSGRARVICSPDGETWQTAALMEWNSGDLRDPRLSVTAEGLLMLNSSIYFVSREPRGKGAYYQLNSAGTPQSEQEIDVARQSVTWLSTDGRKWSSAYACPSGVNNWRWDVTWHNGMGYSVAYTGKDGPGTLYRTRDGQSWRALKTEFFPDGRGNEAALAFGSDNKAYCLLRGGRTKAMIGIGAPPHYQQWEWKDAVVEWGGDGKALPADEVFRVSPGGPKLLRLGDGRLVGAARVDGKATVFSVEPEKGLIRKLAVCDGTSYPGLFEHEDTLWITYGVSDASTVFLAKIPIPK